MTDQTNLSETAAQGQLGADAIPGNVVDEAVNPETDSHEKGPEDTIAAATGPEGDQTTEPLSTDPQPGEPA